MAFQPKSATYQQMISQANAVTQNYAGMAPLQFNATPPPGLSYASYGNQQPQQNATTSPTSSQLPSQWMASNPMYVNGQYAGMGQPQLNYQAMIMDMLGQAYNAQNDARQQNELRYEQALADRQQMMDMVDTLGQQRQADINTQYAGTMADARQRMIDMGLYGSTQAPAMDLAVERQRQGALNSLSEQQAAQRIAILEGIAGQRERRNDTAPTTMDLAALGQMYGSYGSQSGSPTYGIF